MSHTTHEPNHAGDCIFCGIRVGRGKWNNGSLNSIKQPENRIANNTDEPDPSMEDRELELQLIDLFNKVASWGHAMSRAFNKDEFMEMVNKGAVDHQEAAHEAMQLIKARDERREVEWRLDELKKLQALHTRTYRQTVTDNLGNVYVNESHGYISRYETQERIAELEQSLTKKEEAK